MKNKNLSILPVVISLLATSTVCLAVLTGHIGNRESWRIACALSGLTIHVGIAIVFLFNLKRQKSNNS